MKKHSLVTLLFLCLVTAGTTQAQVTTLHNFNGTLGSFPSGKLVLSGNTLYGMASSGGTGGYGCIYSVNTDGSGFNDFWNFADSGVNGHANGASPQGSLTLIGNRLYGMTSGGGSNSRGNVFSIDTNGKGYRDLWDFNDTGTYVGNSNGNTPFGSFLVSGGLLYGMTVTGGAYKNGNVFSIDTDGSHYKDIFDFNGTNGSYSQGSLILSQGVLYGMTTYGGAPGDGNIFSMDTNGNNFKSLYSFSGSNGNDPLGSLILYGHNLYGMTQSGGSAAFGTIFSIDTNGSNFKNLLVLNVKEGNKPGGDLLFSGNLLYGMTYSGGGDGNIFSIDTNGTLITSIFKFDGTDGENPSGTLTLAGGILYGATMTGGSSNNGVVFADAICDLFPLKASSTSDTGNSSGSATVTVTGGPTPYTYLWEPGGQTVSSISGLSIGTYTCTITDENKCVQTKVITISATGIENISNADIQIKAYPSPNDGRFTLQINNTPLAMDNKNAQVEIYNIYGEQVYSQLSTLGSQLSINLSAQPNGVYLYRVIAESGEAMGVGKLVIQK